MRFYNADDFLRRYDGYIMIARKDYENVLHEIVDEMRSAPDLDMAIVCRCRDCIYSKPNDGKLCEGARYCTMHTDGYTLDTVWDCDFCSYGEHRKSEK